MLFSRGAKLARKSLPEKLTTRSKLTPLPDSASAYWAHRLNVSPEGLFAAIQQVGSSVAAVRGHLHK